MQELISRIKKGNPRMKYDFDTVVNRRNTDSLKWNVAENELPMWVADMDFKTAPEITAVSYTHLALIRISAGMMRVW